MASAAGITVEVNAELLAQLEQARADLTVAESKVARMSHRLGLEAHWLEGLAVGLVDGKQYVSANALKQRAAEMEEFVRSLSADPETSPESATDHATRTVGGTL